MNQLSNKTASFTGASSTDRRGADGDLMNFLVRVLIKLGIRNEDLGYHLRGQVRSRNAAVERDRGSID
jgi:hypothetical protein